MDKSEFKAAVISEIGGDIEDMLEAAERDEAGQTRANQVLLGVSKQILDLAQHVDKDLEAGAFNKIGGEPLLLVGAIKKYITRASGVVDTAAMQAAQTRLTCQGRIQALKVVVTNLGRKRDSELDKARRRREYEESLAKEEPVEGDEPVGVGPRPSLKSRRNSDKPEEISKEEEGSSKEVSESSPKSAITKKVQPTRKRSPKG